MEVRVEGEGGGEDGGEDEVAIEDFSVGQRNGQH